MMPTCVSTILPFVVTLFRKNQPYQQTTLGSHAAGEIQISPTGWEVRRVALLAQCTHRRPAQPEPLSIRVTASLCHAPFTIVMRQPRSPASQLRDDALGWTALVCAG